MPPAAIAATPRHAVSRAPEVVKSAVRVLEVLEYFDSIKGPACVGLVATALGFPQSSTSALLRSLVKVGYLRYDPHARTYLPTERVSLLGSWIGGSLFRGGPVLDLVETLAERLDCAVVLARRTGCRAQLVHLATNGGKVPDGMKIGATRSLTSCAIGHVLLSVVEDDELRRLLHRLNADAPPDEVVRIADFVARIGAIRRSGYTVGPNAPHQNPPDLVIAARLPVGSEMEPLVVGLAGPADFISRQQAELLAILREEVRTTLHPPPSALVSFDVPAAFALRTSRRHAAHAPN